MATSARAGFPRRRRSATAANTIVPTANAMRAPAQGRPHPGCISPSAPASHDEIGMIMLTWWNASSAPRAKTSQGTRVVAASTIVHSASRRRGPIMKTTHTAWAIIKKAAT